jgi:UDP-2,3-diacylglucosamine pyrophosphatase LpxH
MSDPANILVVSDLHFGEELLPCAGRERRRAVELGAAAFREFLAYHTARRRDGRPWRLVVNGDCFDFMSVVITAVGDRTPKTADERRFGLGRSVRAGVERMRLLCESHLEVLAALGRFAAAGHSVEIVVGNHDVELLAPEVSAELMRQLAAAGAGPRALERIAVVPWFVYVPGVAWIEHGHIYDEGCSFEFNLAPMDPKDGNLIFNADYAAVRYLGSASPEIDPHGIESWSFWGFMQYALGQGLRPAGRIWMGYARFVASLFRARRLHRSLRRRHRRAREHRARLADVARAGGVPLPTAQAIDRLARAPLTGSVRRLGRLLMLDRIGLILGIVVAIVALFVALPAAWALAGTALTIGAAAGISRWLGTHLVTSQLPMRAIPARLRKLIDAPVVVFGHTHDPRWQPLRGGGLYVNAGTWLAATKPGLRRSFTFVMIQPRPGGPPAAELRQWRDGTSQSFDPRANLGAGITTLPGITGPVSLDPAASAAASDPAGPAAGHAAGQPIRRPGSP